MTKYRIVKRNKTPYGTKCTCYYAQAKLFNLFWIDCTTLNFFNAVEWSLSWDENLYWVEDYVNDKIKEEMESPIKEQVVKIFYSEDIYKN